MPRGGRTFVLGLILPAVLVALLVILVRGRPGTLPDQVHWWPLAAVALGIQLVLYNPPINSQPWALAWGPWIYVATMLGVLAVLARNAFRPRTAAYPWLLAAAGVGLNVLVVTANGGYMPRSFDTTETQIAPAYQDRLTNVAPVSGDTQLVWLGDVVAQPGWLPMANLISVGDILLSGGIALGIMLSAVGTPGLATPRVSVAGRHDQ